MRTVIAGKHVSLRSADLLAGDIHAHNDFEEGNAVAIAPFEGIKVAYEGEDTVLTYTLPACALARITVTAERAAPALPQMPALRRGGSGGLRHGEGLHRLAAAGAPHG